MGRFLDITREAQRRRTAELWSALNRFVQENDATISSLRDTFPARVECSSSSALPSVLGLATVQLDGKRYSFDARRLDEKETAGPVQRMKAPGTIVRVDSFEVAIRSG